MDMATANFKVMLQYLPGGTQENYKILSQIICSRGLDFNGDPRGQVTDIGTGKP